MKVLTRILQYFRGNKAKRPGDDWGPLMRGEDSAPDDKGESIIEEDAESILFYIDCPCGCGKAIQMVLTPAKPGKEYDISSIGNKFWRQLVEEYGLEAAIEFLHENA